MSLKEIKTVFLSKKMLLGLTSVITSSYFWLTHFIIEFIAIINLNLAYITILYHFFGVIGGLLILVRFLSNIDYKKLIIISNFLLLLFLSILLLINETLIFLVPFLLFFIGICIGISISYTIHLPKVMLFNPYISGRLEFSGLFIIGIIVNLFILFYFLNILMSIIFLFLLFPFIILFMYFGKEEFDKLVIDEIKIKLYLIKKDSYSILALSFFMGFFFTETYYAIINILASLVHPSELLNIILIFLFFMFCIIIIVSILAGFSHDYFGRRLNLLIGIYLQAFAFIILGVTLLTVSKDIFPILFIFSIFLGTGFCLSTFGSFLYILETTPVNNERTHIFLNSFTFVSGAIIGVITLELIYELIVKNVIILPFIMLFAYFTATIIIFQLRETLPSRKDLEWKKTLKYIIIIKKSGLTLFSKQLLVQENNINENKQNDLLFGGALVGISAIIQEAVQKSKLKIIQQEDNAILIEEGENVFLSIICDKELPIIRKRMLQFLQDFETFFKELIERDAIETTSFISALRFVEKYFE